MVDMVMEINTTRDIARQILRHRSFSFQEFSQRYADPTKDLAVYMREARLQDKKNRQNSIETNDDDLKWAWEAKQKQIVHEANLAYKWAVENGIAKEQARAVLPEGNMQSRMYMKGSVRSWIHYCELRCGNGTQKEHREVAYKCAGILKEYLPFLKQWYKELPND
jgi:thymidylate synthase (FAD)